MSTAVPPLLEVLFPEVMAAMEDPLLVIDRDRRLLFHNPAANRILKLVQGLEVRTGRLIVHDQDAGSTLQRALSSSDQVLKAGGAGQGVRLPRKPGTRDWYVVCRPLTPQAPEATHCYLLHFVGRVHPRRVPGRVLRGLFGLSHREVSLLSRVIQNEPLRQIAERMSLSLETVRAYLKKIFRKCDVHSRAELLALLQRLSLFT